MVVVTKQFDCGTFKLWFVRENEPEMTAKNTIGSCEKNFTNKQSSEICFWFFFGIFGCFSVVLCIFSPVFGRASHMLVSTSPPLTLF